jgi:hypothetical protein
MLAVMSAEYRIDKKRRLVLSTGSGVFTMADSLAHQDKLLHDPDFAPDFCQLWDLSLVTEVQLTSDDLRRLAQRPVFSPDSRRAVLVSSDLAFGLSRMFAIFREILGETGIRVFRDRGEALDWVLGKNTID